MAEIATYTCSNKKCLFTLRLARGLKGRTDHFCYTCNKTSASIECSQCLSTLAHEQYGNSCPRCSVGILAMPRLTVFSN